MAKQTAQAKKVYSNWVSLTHINFLTISLAAGLTVSCAAIVCVLTQSFASILGASVTIKRESPELSLHAITHFPRARAQELVQNSFAIRVYHFASSVP